MPVDSDFPNWVKDTTFRIYIGTSIIGAIASGAMDNTKRSLEVIKIVMLASSLILTAACMIPKDKESRLFRGLSGMIAGTLIGVSSGMAMAIGSTTAREAVKLVCNGNVVNKVAGAVGGLIGIRVMWSLLIRRDFKGLRHRQVER